MQGLRLFHGGIFTKYPAAKDPCYSLAVALTLPISSHEVYLASEIERLPFPLSFDYVVYIAARFASSTGVLQRSVIRAYILLHILHGGQSSLLMRLDDGQFTRILTNNLLCVLVFFVFFGLDALNDFADPLIHGKHYRLTRSNTQDTRRNTLVERSHTLSSPHILSDDDDAAEC